MSLAGVLQVSALLQATDEGTEAQGAIGLPMVLGFPESVPPVVHCSHPADIAELWGWAMTVNGVTTKKVAPLRRPRALVLTDQASVTGIVGEKEPEARKRSVFIECWALKTEE